MFCSGCGAENTPGTRFCSRCGNALGTRDEVASTPVSPGGNIPANPTFVPAYATGAVALTSNYATWANRVIAYLIDFALVAGGMFVLYFVAGSFLAGIASIGGRSIGGLASTGCCMMLLLFPTATILVGLYNRVYLIAKRGYSIGQGVVKIKVVDANGSLLGTGTLVIRLFAQAILEAIPIVGLLDVLWPLWDQTRQTLHDKAVGSFVINNPAST